MSLQEVSRAQVSDMLKAAGSISEIGELKFSMTKTVPSARVSLVSGVTLMLGADR